ncbi:hypothetical protein [Streptomyces massasporeus]|uniref:hypothetical protein n=1 Tax=Streptomyces massasporeus TaxID=67324 RepID=UPI0033336B0F
MPRHHTHQEELIPRQLGYAHIDDLLGPFPAYTYNQEGPGSADFPRWVLPFLAAQVAEEARTSPETTTVDLLPNGQVVERAPAAFVDEGWEDRVVDPNPDGTYSVGEDWWWYTMDARTALRFHLRALARPGTRHRRYRAMVAAHAAATLAADTVTTLREQFANRQAKR